MNIFTPKQIKAWKRYEAVRKEGRYNMLTTTAGLAARLTPQEHLFCIKNYTELKAAVEAQG